MFLCPNITCGLVFTDETAIAAHLGNPRYICGTLYEAIPGSLDDEALLGYSSDIDAEELIEYIDTHEDREELDLPSLEALRPHPQEPTADPTAFPHDPPIHTSFFKEYHSNRAASSPNGLNLLQKLDDDQYAHIRNNGNPHYPFANKSEWELVRWMNDACLTQQQIDAFLKLSY
ncbi:hypothetical protein H0H87_006738, partial [Tephrocybe sp. NHM501043]